MRTTILDSLEPPYLQKSERMSMIRGGVINNPEGFISSTEDFHGDGFMRRCLIRAAQNFETRDDKLNPSLLIHGFNLPALFFAILLRQPQTTATPARLRAQIL